MTIKRTDDQFWGHFGVLLSGDDHTRWSPVSWHEANSTRRHLSSFDRTTGWIVVRTLNNRALAFPPIKMKRIWLLDDGSDAPKDDFKRRNPIDDYQGICSGIYQLMANWADEGSFSKNDAPVLSGMALAHIERGGFLDRPNELRAFLRHTVIHFKDGTTTSYEADHQNLIELIDNLDDPELDIIKISSQEDEFECYYSLSMLQMIDIPLIELNVIGYDIDDD